MTLLVLGWTSLACLRPAQAQDYGSDTSPAEQIRQHLQTAADRTRELYDRSSAIDNIGYLGEAARDAVPELMGFLEDSNEQIASSALNALRSIVQDPGPLLPAFKAALEKPGSARTALFVLEKLGSLGTAAEPFVPQIVPLLGHPSIEVRGAAAQTAGSIGPGALPAAAALIRLLDDQDPTVALNASLALSAVVQKLESVVPVLITAYQDESRPAGRLYAARQLSQAGRAAAPARDALLEGFQKLQRQPELRSATADALGTIGDEALPAAAALIGAIDDDSSQVSLSALLALNQIVLKPERIVPVLTAAFQDASRPKGRLYAAQQLASARAAAAPAVQPLLACFEKHDETQELRSAAASALGAVGPRAAPAVRALIRGLGEPSSELSLTAALALNQIVLEQTPFHDVFLDALRDKSNAAGRVYAADQLALLGPAAEKAVPALLEALTTPGTPRLQRSAANALGRIGQAAEPAVAALLDALDADDAELALTAGMALRAIIVKPLRVLPVILEALRDPRNRPARIFCAGQAAAIGPEARAAVPSLIECLADRDSPELRAAAAGAIGGIGPDAVEAVRPLIRTLDDSLPEVGGAARQALSRVAPRPEKILEVLLEAVRDKANEPGRIWVVEQLGRVGQRSAPAVQELRDCLASGVPELRRAAAETLGHVGPAAQPAAPDLMAILDDLDASVATQARSSLERIVAKPAELLPLLLAAIPDEKKPNTRLYAVETLVRVGPKARAVVPALLALAGEASGQLRESALKALGSVAPLKLAEAVSATAGWYEAHYVDWIGLPAAGLGETEQYAEIVEGLGALTSSRAFDAAPGWIKALAYYDVALGYMGRRDSEQGLAWFAKAVEQGFDDVANVHGQPALRVHFDEPRLRGAYAKIQVADADLFEIGWMVSEIIAADHETGVLILENIGREDPDFTELPQVQLPARETKSPTVRALRQILRRKLDQQKQVVFLSDKSRIQHLSTMGVISNMGGVAPGSSERAFRILLSRKRATDHAADRRLRVAARQKLLTDGTASTQPHAAPDLGTYRRPS